MRYDPNATPCLPDGEYEAVIMEAKEGCSKAGNDMVIITWRVYGNGGGVVEINDYIVDSQPWKLKRIAKAVGCLDSFETGHFNPDEYENKSATLTLSTKEDDYGPKNEIKSYATLQRTKRANANDITDDDIKF